MGRPYVVGISGGTASGKSTLSRMLEQELADLKVKTFHMDAYFKPDGVRPKAAAPVTGVVYYDDNCPETIYAERLREDLARAAGEGFDIILVEGLFALWYDWLAGFENLYRLPGRRTHCAAAAAEHGGTGALEEVAGVYLDMVRYRHEQYIEPTKWRADLILNGSSPSQLANGMLLDFLRRQVREKR